MTQPSEFRRGWSIVLAAMVGAGCGVGALPFYTLGVFILPVQEALDTSRAGVQGAWLAVSLVNAVLSPFVGAMVDRIGGRTVGLFGLIGLGFGLMSVAVIAQSLIGFYLAAILFALLGSGTSPVTWTRIVNGWFDRNRGLALGLTLMGTGIAGALAPSYAAWAVSTYGWKLGYVALGLLPLVIALPIVALFFREAEKSPAVATKMAHPSQDGVDLGTALSDWRFWLLIAAFFGISIGVGGGVVNLVPILRDSGFDSQSAATIAGLIGISVMIGRLGAGFLIDRFWAPGVAAVMLSLPAVSCFILMQDEITRSEAAVAAVILGLAAGAEFDIIAYLTVKYFGLKHYGKLYGVQFGSLTIAAGGAPLLYGWVFDQTGSYAPILTVAAALFVIGAVSLLALGPYRIRVR